MSLIHPDLHSLVGTAIDYRIRYYFRVTAFDKLAAWHGAEELVRQGSSNVQYLPVIDTERGIVAFAEYIGLSPDPMLDSIDYAHLTELAFFATLHAELLRLHPECTRLSRRDEELLARYCWVLALYEKIYRSGQVHEELHAAKDVHDLLRLASDTVVEDLCQLSWAFYDGFHDLLSRPATLNPHFAGGRDVDGADGDLIIDGCLLEVKATINPRLEKRWLHQLLGYVLLDYEDRYQLNQIGIYYARQTTEIRWDLGDLIHSLSGNESLSIADLRQRFRERFERPRKRLPRRKP
jgi:hypothetical protein